MGRARVWGGLGYGEGQGMGRDRVWGGLGYGEG